MEYQASPRGSQSQQSATKSTLLGSGSSLDASDREMLLFLQDCQKLLTEDVSRELNLPRVAVFGDEKSGKSSVLNRLVGIDIFPVDRYVATMCPVDIYLSPCQISDVTTSTIPAHECNYRVAIVGGIGSIGQVMGGVGASAGGGPGMAGNITAAQAAAKAAEQQAALAAAQGRVPLQYTVFPWNQPFSEQFLRRINELQGNDFSNVHVALYVESPSFKVPLSFTDMPGLRVFVNDRDRILRIVEPELRRYADNGIFLWIHDVTKEMPGTEAINVFKRLEEQSPNVVNNIIGVVTKVDVAPQQHMHKAEALLKKEVHMRDRSTESMEQAIRLTQGWYAVCPTLRDADQEMRFFSHDVGGSAVLPQERCGVEQMKNRVIQLLLERVRAFIRNDLSEKLEQKRREADRNLKQCGPPLADRRVEATRLMDNVIKTLVHALDERNSDTHYAEVQALHAFYDAQISGFEVAVKTTKLFETREAELQLLEDLRGKRQLGSGIAFFYPGNLTRNMGYFLQQMTRLINNLYSTLCQEVRKLMLTLVESRARVRYDAATVTRLRQIFSEKLDTWQLQLRNKLNDLIEILPVTKMSDFVRTNLQQGIQKEVSGIIERHKESDPTVRANLLQTLMWQCSTQVVVFETVPRFFSFWLRQRPLQDLMDFTTANQMIDALSDVISEHQSNATLRARYQRQFDSFDALIQKMQSTIHVAASASAALPVQQVVQRAQQQQQQLARQALPQQAAAAVVSGPFSMDTQLTEDAAMNGPPFISVAQSAFQPPPQQQQPMQQQQAQFPSVLAAQQQQQAQVPPVAPPPPPQPVQQPQYATWSQPAQQQQLSPQPQPQVQPQQQSPEPQHRFSWSRSSRR